MCGICGIVKPKAPYTPEDEQIVEKMKEVLIHRGPDGEGTTTGERFVFGHRRLAIIDPEHAIQPMQTEDGRFTLTFNGEIYNYVELRQEMISGGVSFNTFSDVEVLLRLFVLEGTSCLKKLNGMFAFAIFDSKTNTFFAARDNFGIKPFYYKYLKNGDIVFASEIKALFQHPEIKPSVNQEALQEYITFQFCLGDKCMFDGIMKLEPAHMIVWKLDEGSNGKIYKYWDYNFKINDNFSEEYFSETLFSLLRDSVKLQLRSDVPVGAHLSGGLDSSTIGLLAAPSYSNNFQFFTGKFLEGSKYDESKYARLLAKKAKGVIHEIIPKPDDFIENIAKLIYFMDEPAAGPGLLPQYIVSRYAAQHVKVVLGGQGGDELFGGYARYLIGYLEQALKGAIFKTQEEGRHLVTLSSIIPNLPILKEYHSLMQEFWKEGLFDNMDLRYFRLIHRMHDIDEIFSKDIIANFNKEGVFENFQRIFNQPSTKSYINKMTHFDLKTLLPALLHVEDRTSMSVSLESRVPFLDVRIANLVTTMPPAVKFKGGETKYILKRAVAHTIPEEILNREDKMGFPVPLKEWITNSPVGDFVSDILLSSTCKNRGIFNVKALEKLIISKESYSRQLWGALCLELWFQQFID